MEAVFGRPRENIDQHGRDLQRVSHCVDLRIPLCPRIFQYTVENDKRGEVEDRQVLDPHELVVLSVDHTLLRDQQTSQHEKDTRG